MQTTTAATTCESSQTQGLRELRVECIAEHLAHVAELWRKPAGEYGCKDPNHFDCAANLTPSYEAGLVKRALVVLPPSSYKWPVALMVAGQLSKLNKLPFAPVTHELLYRASANADGDSLAKLRGRLPVEMLTAGFPRIVKTVTLFVHESSGYKRLVVTELGDSVLDDVTLDAVSDATGICRNRLKRHAHINSPEFDPIGNLGQEPGNVGPFATFANNIDHFIYRRLDAPEYVAVRFSPFYTTCMHRKIFEAVAFAALERLGHKYICI